MSGGTCNKIMEYGKDGCWTRNQIKDGWKQHRQIDVIKEEDKNSLCNDERIRFARKRCWRISKAVLDDGNFDTINGQVFGLDRKYGYGVIQLDDDGNGSYVVFLTLQIKLGNGEVIVDMHQLNALKEILENEMTAKLQELHTKLENNMILRNVEHAVVPITVYDEIVIKASSELEILPKYEDGKLNVFDETEILEALKEMGFTPRQR